MQSILRPGQHPLLRVWRTAPTNPKQVHRNTALESKSTHVAIRFAAGKASAPTFPEETSPEVTTSTKLTMTKKSSPQQKSNLMAALSLLMASGI